MNIFPPGFEQEIKNLSIDFDGVLHTSVIPGTIHPKDITMELVMENLFMVVSIL